MALILLGVQLIFLCFFIRATFITISCYWFQPRRLRRIMAKQGVHGPEPRFLLGNLVEVSSLVSKTTSQDMDSIHHDILARLMPHYVLWSKQYGKRFIIWNGSEPRMCLVEIDLIKEFFSSKNTILSGRSWLQQQGSIHFIGRGLLMSSTNHWSHQRHLIAPVFMGEMLKQQVRFMVGCTKQMVESLKSKYDSGDSEVQVWDIMSKLTAEIISRTEFGASYQKGMQIFDLLTKLQHFAAQSSRHFSLPGSQFFPSKYNKEIKSLNKEVERLLMEIIQSRRDGLDIGRTASYGHDLLGMLLPQIGKQENSFKFDLQLLMDECKTVFFAGHETTALHLTWTIMLLAVNPEWQNKVRDEVSEVCKGESPSADHLPNFTLLNMVINESLRLYPPAVTLPRYVYKDIKLGDLHIPRGLSIWIPVLAFNHSEELWGKDVHEFNPERFNRKSSEAGRLFMPFSFGPRDCVGRTFALMETKIVLAMLISKFSFTISKNYRHAPISVLTLKPKHGVQICLKPI